MSYKSPQVYDVATCLQLSVDQRLVYALGMGINVVNERDSHSQCRPKSYCRCGLDGLLLRLADRRVPRSKGGGYWLM